MAVAGSAHAVVDPRVANVGLPTHEPVAVHRVASRNQRVGAVGRQAHLRARNARGHTPTHIECDLRQRDGVGRWARIVVGISHMALVIRVVQVAAVPALREPQLQGNRFARRTVRNHVNQRGQARISRRKTLLCHLLHISFCPENELGSSEKCEPGPFCAIGSIPNWAVAPWSVSKFARRHDDPDRCYVTEYDDSLNAISERVVPAAEGKMLPDDAQYGSGVVEVKLAKLVQ
jgi:hypothetical protein